MSFVASASGTPLAHFLFHPRSGTAPAVNATRFRANFATFLDFEMPVSRVATGRFSTDLTATLDDLLVAVVSLLLLLSLHGLLSTIFLRVLPGARLSSPAFSLTQFLHLARDFRLRHLLRGRGPVARRLHVNQRLAALAFLLLLASFATEFLVLFYTSPEAVPVTNESASISLAQPVAPSWPRVVSHSRTPTNPCAVLFLSGVDQRSTRLTTCLTSTLAGQVDTPFRELYAEDAEPRKVVITTDLHEYGVRHTIAVGDSVAEFDARAYYTLDDGKGRIVANRIMKGNNLPAMRFVHRILIAFIFSAYKNDTADPRVTAQSLTDDLLPRIKTASMPGPDINVIKINNAEKFLRVVSDRYVTTFKTRLPADPILSFARTVLKSMIAVRILGPDTKDLIMGSGTRTENVGVLWYESSRGLNWLSLSIILASSFLFLFLVRFYLPSVSAAHIADLMVEKELEHAGRQDPFAHLEERDLTSFSVGVVWDEEEHPLGALTIGDNGRIVDDDFYGDDDAIDPVENDYPSRSGLTVSSFLESGDISRTSLW